MLKQWLYPDSKVIFAGGKGIALNIAGRGITGYNKHEFYGR
jgi:hypothetical protein